MTEIQGGHPTVARRKYFAGCDWYLNSQGQFETYIGQVRCVAGCFSGYRSSRRWWVYGVGDVLLDEGTDTSYLTCMELAASRAREIVVEAEGLDALEG